MKHKKILNTLVLLLTAALVLGCEESTGPGDGSNNKPPGYQEDIPWPSLADSPWPMYHNDPQCTGRSHFPGPTQGFIEWTIDSLFLEASIVTGIDSNFILMGQFESYGLYSIGFDGNTKWISKEEIYINEWHSTPLVASDGTIYITSGLNQKGLYAINHSGHKKWLFESDASIEQLGINIDKNGNIYFIDVERTLYKISPTGQLIWKYYHQDFSRLSQTVITFSPDGKTIYIPGDIKTVYAFNINSKKNRMVFWRWAFIRRTNC